MLFGHRIYHVARQPARRKTILNFRMDRLHAAEVMDESFVFASEFTLEDGAGSPIDLYQDPAQYGEVLWCFVPEAAECAA